MNAQCLYRHPFLKIRSDNITYTNNLCSGKWYKKERKMFEMSSFLIPIYLHFR